MKTLFASTTIRMVRQFSLPLLLSVLPIIAKAAMPAAEKLLPADTLFVISAPDGRQLREAYNKSPLSQLLNDSAMKPFRDKFVSKWKDEFVTPLERELGVKLDSYCDLWQGQFTLAVTQNGWQGADGPEPATLFLLDAREKSGQLKTNLAQLRKKWVDSGKSVKTETIRGVEFWTTGVSTNTLPGTLQKFFPQRQEIREKGKEDEPKPTSKSDFVVGQYESLLIAGNSIKAVESVMARLTGSSAPVLADEATFAACQGALLRNAPLYMWINAKKILGVILAMPEEQPNPEAPSPLPAFSIPKILNATGVGALKAVALAWRSGSEGSGFDFFVGAPDSTRTGLIKILATDAKDSNPPAFVPVDVVKFQRWRLDGQKAVAAMEKMLGEISPQALSVWNFFISTGDAAGKENDPDFDLRKNLFGNLGDDIVSYSKVPRGTTPQELGAPPSLVLIGSPNAEKMAASLKGLLAIVSPNAKPKEREFLGKKIYTVPLLRAPIGTSPKSTAKSLSYAASGGYVAISPDTAILEEYIRSAETPPKPLRELPGLAEAAQKVGGQATGTFNYENQVERMRALFQLLKSSAGKSTNDTGVLDPLAGAMPFASPEKTVKDWLDFSLLPEFDRVSKYFHFTVSSGITTPDGITYKFFAPTPPKLKN